MLALLALLSVAAAGSGALYETRRASRDGTGRFYMGREIAQVMGHRGAGWLERSSRDREEGTSKLVEILPVEPDDVVADIGAGTGFFAFPMAERVSRGSVLAVDIQPEMLAIIEVRKRERGVENVRTILGQTRDPGLPEAGVDLILIVDAYHEFSHPAEMGAAMVRALRPGGRLVLVEYREEDPSVPIKPLHKMSEAQVRREIERLGLAWERTDGALPRQHVVIFRKPAGAGPGAP